MKITTQAEISAMLVNVLAKLQESDMSRSEIIGWVMAESVRILKIIPEADGKQKSDAKQAAPATVETPVQAPTNKDSALPTGPAAIEWKAPENGFWRFDGRFVKDKTWKPVEPVAVEESKPAAGPNRLIAVTLPNGMTKWYDDTPEFREQLNREKAAKAEGSVVYVPPVKNKLADDKLIMQEKITANTYGDHRSHFLSASSEERKSS